MAEIAGAGEWFAAVSGLADRAEELADPPGTYVGTAFLGMLLNKRNQVIFGRRGTGKTHLLRRLQDELVARLGELRVLPAYVDGATLGGWMPPCSDPAAIALGLYAELVRDTVGELARFIDAGLRPGRRERFFPGAPRAQLGQVRDSVARLDRLLTAGQVRMLPAGGAQADYEDLDEVVSRQRVAAGGNAAAALSDTRTLGIKLEAPAAKELRESVPQVSTRTVAGQAYLPFAGVTELIRRLLGMLGEASLAILVDDWSLLGDADVQPLLAQLLRLTARGGICVKLACVPGRTRLVLPGEDGRNPVGLELGDDITADVDLDSVVFAGNDIKQLAGFFMALLQSHLAPVIPAIRDASPDEFARYMLTERMADERVLAELCHASGAVPRDFINVFRQATSLQQAAGAGTMTVANVRTAARRLRQSKDRGSLRSPEPRAAPAGAARLR